MAESSGPIVRWVLAVLVAGALVLGAVDASAAIPATERAALVALYNSTTGSSWITKTNWLGPAGTSARGAGSGAMRARRR